MKSFSKYILCALGLVAFGFVLGEIGLASKNHFQPMSIPVVDKDLTTPSEESPEVPPMSTSELHARIDLNPIDPILPYEVTKNLPDVAANLPLYEETKQSTEEAIPVTSDQNAPRAKPRIALVLDDLGMAHQATLRSIDLPPEVTLSFLPYAPHLQEQVDKALKKDHEILLHLPMEPVGFDNPGPQALLTNLSEEENKARLEKALASFQGFIGVNNHMGSKFTSNEEKMRPLLAALRERKLFFLDSRTSSQSVAMTVARSEGVPVAGRDIFLDDVLTAEAIRGELSRAEMLAQKKRRVIVIGHPHALTLTLLEEWLGDIQERGFDLVPLTDLIDR